MGSLQQHICEYISYPGTPVRLQAWKIDGEKRALFRYIDVESGKAILDHCEFEWV